MKLRLIKSNSCSSRLELTGLDDHHHHHRLNKAVSRNRSVSHLEQEDTVRNIIQRIESNQMCEKRVPRIIESKCIEKTNGDSGVGMAMKCKAPSFHSNGSNNHFGRILTKSQSAERLGPMEILSHVSVKNHINSCGSLASIVERPSPTPTSKSNVLPRNKNVDLALEINKGIVSKTSKDKANKTTRKEATVPLNAIDSIKMKNTSSNTATVRPQMLSKNELQEKLIKENHKAIMQDLCKAVARCDDDQSNGNVNQKSRLAKWETLSSFDEKNYLANDVALKQKLKYDEIEFEEFEVIEANN